MRIITVRDARSWNWFHEVPFRIYAGDANWISPLRGDIRGIFDPAKNAAAARGDYRLFVLLDEQDRPIGRIAAFIDSEVVGHQAEPIGGIGFFESPNNKEAARILFGEAEAWLRERGMHGVDGPVNFGGRDKYWGLLVRGFFPPLFQENYHPAYYATLFESNGYIPWEQILTLKGSMADLDLERLRRVCDRVRQQNQVEVALYDPARVDRHVRDFCTIYNAAFSQYEHFKEAEPGKIKALLQESRLILDPRLLAICYINGEPAAFCATFPEINPLLRSAQGRLPWWKIPGFLFRLKTARRLFVKGTGFAIHPDFRTKGAFALIIEYMASPGVVNKYPAYFLTTVRAHNKEAVSLYFKAGEMRVDRIHVGYRKALHPDFAVIPNEFTE